MKTSARMSSGPVVPVVSMSIKLPARFVSLIFQQGSSFNAKANAASIRIGPPPSRCCVPEWHGSKRKNARLSNSPATSSNPKQDLAHRFAITFSTPINASRISARATMWAIFKVCSMATSMDFLMPTSSGRPLDQRRRSQLTTPRIACVLGKARCCRPSHWLSMPHSRRSCGLVDRSKGRSLFVAHAMLG